MIDPIMGWFEMTEYNDKRTITISNLVETMRLTRYIWPTEITYDQVSKFICHELIKNFN